MNRHAAILTTLSISQWSGRKLDKEVSYEVTRQHNADSRAGRWSKSLLPGDTILSEIGRISREIREEQNRYTLPWRDDGWRLLPSAQYLDHAARVRGWRTRWDTAVSEFAAAYPASREAARAALNGMYQAADYPENIIDYFALEVRYQPVPDAEDFRLHIPESELAALKAEAQASVEAAMVRAQADLKERIREALSHIQERLTSPKAIFRDSLIENARDLAALVPRLLIEPDPSITALAAGLAEIAKADPDTLRHSNRARQEAAAEAGRLLADMQAFAGGTL